MNDQLLGALIELVGATICIVGLNLQRWAALSIVKAQEEGRAVSGCGAKCGGWRWLLAMTVFMGGQIVQTVAYAFGTQTLVSAVSNVSLVVNVVVAHYAFGEHFAVRPVHSFGFKWLQGWDLGAMVILIAGSVVTAVYAPVSKTAHEYDLAFHARTLHQGPIRSSSSSPLPSPASARASLLGGAQDGRAATQPTRRPHVRRGGGGAGQHLYHAVQGERAAGAHLHRGQ